MRKTSISKRMTGSFAIILLFIILSNGFAIIMMHRMSEDNDHTFQYKVEPLYALDDINAYLNRTMTNIRSLYIYLQLGKTDLADGIIERYESDREHLLSALESTNLSLKSSPYITDELLHELEDLNVAVNKYISMSDSQLRIALSGNTAELAATFISEETRNAAMNAIDLALTLFNDNMSNALLDNDLNTKNTNLTISVLIGVFAIVLVLTIILAALLIKSITQPISRLKRGLNEIANGNLNINFSSTAVDEIGDLTRDAEKMANILRKIVNEMTLMEKEHGDGEIDSRMDASQFHGTYKDMVEGTNKMVGDYIVLFRELLDCMKGFSEGDFSIPLRQYPGKKVEANHTIEGLRGNLKSINTDLNKLITSSIKGELSVRVDPGKYQGEWAGIINGLNSLMNTVLEPIQEAAEVLQEISRGNFDRMVTGHYQGDYLIIKNSLNDTVTNISSYIEEISRVLEAMSNNNLDHSISREYVGSFSNIRTAVNNIIYTLNKVMSEIISASEQVAAASRQVSDSSMSLAEGSTRQAGAIQELSASVSIISQNTTQNAHNANQAKDLSSASRRNASKGNNDMSSMLNSMNMINQSAGKISEIIKVIDDIAFQTNLLALNAAVEAARAGVHGKGFAVVAEEVRNLAAKCQNAAQETSVMIEEAISRTKEGTDIANETSSALQTIVHDATQMADIIANIAEASTNQANSIQEINHGLTEITDVTQSNSSISEESASASQQLASQAEVMMSLVSVFKLKRY